MDTSKNERIGRKMREIGGYIELDTYHLAMLHEHAIALNCGRNALAYVLRAKKIKKLKIPYFLCDSVCNVCKRENVDVLYYHIGIDFKPVDLSLNSDEWLYLVNYYGQLTNEEIDKYVQVYKRVIVDQAQSYFQMPIEGVDTIYTCRKWFGVADGAFLYTNEKLDEDLPQDESFDRMRFLLGRYERSANEFYDEYRANNKFFADEPIKRMSKLTMNLLHGIDYRKVEQIRTENFECLQSALGVFNALSPRTNTFMYPLMLENGQNIRKKLQAEKIYIPLLWPTVSEIVSIDSLDYQMAMNILPLPIDQRYDQNDMNIIMEEIIKCIKI